MTATCVSAAAAPAVGAPVGCLYVPEEAQPTHSELRFRGRTRFIEPLESRPAAAGRRLFMGGRKRLGFTAAGCIDRLLGRSPALREAPLAEHIRAAVPGAVWTYTSIGTPGAWQKHTVLLLDEAGAPIAIAKVGATSATASLLENEASWLRRLAGIDGLRDSVPRLVYCARVDEAQVVIGSVSRGKQVGKLAADKYVPFLSCLQRAHTRVTTFAATNMRRNIERWLEALPAMSVTWKRRLKAALALTDTLFGDEELPFAAAHHDFVPWNMRVHRGQLFVFDWEFAQEEYVPLYDLIHYEMMKCALQGRIGVQRASAAVRRASAAAAVALMSDGACKCDQGQLLAYLLEHCVFYLTSVRGVYDRHPVLDCYGFLMDQLCDVAH